MELPTYFSDFLEGIRPTQSHIDDYQCGHTTLRERLRDDKRLSAIWVSDFLQGSYRRATANRPRDGKRADVDVILVTKLSRDEYTPQQALEVFVPFVEKHYSGKYEIQGRSIGIHLSYVDLDLVITAAPSESEMGILKSDAVTGDDTPEDASDWRLVKSWVSPVNRSWNAEQLLKIARSEPEWKLSPLYIPDREANQWQRTHPIAQIHWTWEKNAACNKHYVNVVKAIKWWRRVRYPESKHPKGYPLEHVIGQCCSDGITSVAQGVTQTLERIATAYQTYVALQMTPVLPDHGVPEHNVLARVSVADFADFHGQVCTAAGIARRALDAKSVKDSADAWREMFGSKFPEAPEEDNAQGGGGSPRKGGFTERTAPSVIAGGRFA